MTAKAHDLCLASDVAGDLGVSPDDRVQRCVSAASRAIARYCARTFEREAGIVEYPASSGGPTLPLSRSPVASISEVVEANGVISSSFYECVGLNAEAGIVLRLSGSWRLVLQSTGLIGDVIQREGRTDNIKITYTAGYVTPGQKALDDALTVTLPEDVQEAAIMTAVAIYRGHGRDPAIEAESIGDWSIKYADSSGAVSIIPPTARALLAPHVRWSA